MKLFGWIQCKLRNGSPGLLKDSGDAGKLSLKPSRNDQQDYPRPKNYVKNAKQQQHDFERYINECNERAQEEIGEAVADTFPGFLTIGTLNMESTATEPATPTFGFPPEEGYMEEMNYDLKVINEELEKFFKAEAESEGFEESRRASEASTITLSGKEKERLDNDDVEAKAFPLQGYLFASSYDLSASKEEAEKEKASLLELFTWSRDGDRSSACVKIEREEDQAIRKYKAPPSNPMRRLLKTLHLSHKKNDALKDGSSIEGSSSSRKFHKIKQLFQRKVHPEGNRSVKEGNKLSKSKNGKSNYMCSTSKGGPTSSTKLYNHTSKARNSRRFQESVEQWIRTDADYLVLELAQN